MFCPRCSQEQVNKEIKYCSRCGLPLVLVAQILAYDGDLPQFGEIDKTQRSRFTRSNGWKFGVTWFLVFTFLIAPFLAIAGADAIPELAVIIGLIGGMLITLFSLMYLKKEPQSLKSEHFISSPKAGEYDALPGKTNQNVLPPQQSIPTSAYVPPSNSWKAPDTSDLSRPGSVTEGTTKLLEKDERN